MIFGVICCLFFSLCPFGFLCLYPSLLLILCIELILPFLECVELEAVYKA